MEEDGYSSRGLVPWRPCCERLAAIRHSSRLCVSAFKAGASLYRPVVSLGNSETRQCRGGVPRLYPMIFRGTICARTARFPQLSGTSTPAICR